MEYLCPGAVCFVSPNVQEWDLMKQRAGHRWLHGVMESSSSEVAGGWWLVNVVIGSINQSRLKTFRHTLGYNRYNTGGSSRLPAHHLALTRPAPCSVGYQPVCSTV